MGAKTHAMHGRDHRPGGADPISFAIGEVAGVGARVYRTTDFSIANNNPPSTTVGYIDFDNEDYDTSGMHDNSTNPGRITCTAAAGAGYYLAIVNVPWDSNATGYRQIEVAVVRAATPTVLTTINMVGTKLTGQDLMHQVVAPVQLVVGDYLVCAAYQDSGGARNLVGSTRPLNFTVIKLASIA